MEKLGQIQARHSLRARVALLAILFVAVLPNTPSAGGEFAQILESPISRFVLTRTEEGLGILSKVLGLPLSSAGEAEMQAFLRRLRDPALLETRGDLESALYRAQSLLEEYRWNRDPDLRTPSREKANPGELTPDEELLLRGFAAARFQVNPEWMQPTAGLSPLARTRIEFIRTPSPDAMTRARRAFLKQQEGVDPYLEMSPDELRRAIEAGTAEEQALGLRRLTRFAREMEACRQSMPEPVARKIRTDAIAVGLVQGQVFTVGNYLFAEGSQRIRWEDLSNDMLMSAIGAFYGSGWAMRPREVYLRWVRLIAFGEARTVLDATIYTGKALARGEENALPTSDGWGLNDRLRFRAAYNAGFSAVSSGLFVGTHTLIEGLLCHPGVPQWIKKSTHGLRVLVSAGSSFAYFQGRKHFRDGY